MTSPLAATLGSSGRVASGLMDSGALGAALPCTFAERSRLLPDVFDDCSYVSRRLSPRHGAIIRKLKETAYALNFLEAVAVLVILSRAKRWGTPYCPQTWHHQHFTVSIL